MSRKESSPIHASQAGAAYTLVFIDDRQNENTVLMRVTFDTGEIHEERVARESADGKLKSAALFNDSIDSRLHEIVASHALGAS